MDKILQDKYENQTKITDVKPLEQIWLGWRDIAFGSSACSQNERANFASPRYTEPPNYFANAKLRPFGSI